MIWFECSKFFQFLNVPPWSLVDPPGKTNGLLELTILKIVITWGAIQILLIFFCFNIVGLIDIFSCFAMKIIKKCAKFSTHNLKNFNQTKTWIDCLGSNSGLHWFFWGMTRCHWVNIFDQLMVQNPYFSIIEGDFLDYLKL